jgi:hypothetical protein
MSADEFIEHPQPKVLRYPVHTCEHALELVGIFKATSLLQLRNHARFALVRSGYTMNKTLRQLGGVERLEHVLVLDVLE